MSFNRITTVYACGDFAQADPPVREGTPIFFDADGDLIYAPSAFCTAVTRQRAQSIRTAQTYATAIKSWLIHCLVKTVDWTRPRLDEVLQWRDSLAALEKPVEDRIRLSTVNCYVTAVLSFYRWAYAAHLVVRDPFVVHDHDGHPTQHRVPDKMWRFPPSRGGAPRSIPSKYIGQIIDQLKEPFTLMAVLSGTTGARAFESSSLPMASLPARVTGGDFVYLPITGKGAIPGVLSTPTRTAARLIHYRDFVRCGIVSRCRRTDPTYVEPKELFLRHDGQPFSSQAFSKAWRRATVAAGLGDRNFVCHGLRHSYAYAMLHMLMANNSHLATEGNLQKALILQLMPLMRHSRESSTMAYLRGIERDAALVAFGVSEIFDRFL